MADIATTCAGASRPVGMLMCEAWNIPEGFATLILALATILAGSFAVAGAIVAWRSVQRQVASVEQIERERRDLETQTIAAALAGEMQAYFDNLKPEKVIADFRTMAGLAHSVRQERLAMFSELPKSHPVFDNVAAKIGGLSLESARGVSRFYNVITGFRLLFSHVASQRFYDAGEKLQQQYILQCASMFEQELPSLRAIIADVERAASRATPRKESSPSSKGFSTNLP